MSIEDRVRAATRARADQVRDIRPLEFPEDRPGGARRQRARQAQAWLLPFAAAAAVVALAVTLLAVRQAAAPHPGQTPAAASAVPADVLAAIPRYYAVISRDSSVPFLADDLTVLDDRTGKKQGDGFQVPGNGIVRSISATADNRTFLYAAAAGGPWQVTALHRDQAGSWSPQDAPVQQPGTDILSVNAVFSPDNQEIAVLSTENGPSGTMTTLQLYRNSHTARPPLRTWTAVVPTAAQADGNSLIVSWLSDGRHVAFSTGVPGGVLQERVIDTTAPSGGLLLSSKVIFAGVQSKTASCATLRLTPDGGTVLCGTQIASAACAKQAPAIVAYSVRSGKPERVMESGQPSCGAGAAVPVWTDPAARHVIGVFPGSPNGSGSAQLLAFAGGQRYSLPLPVTPAPGNTVAF